MGAESITHDQWVEYFEYLDDLRESGATNMYGAASYLEDEATFGLGRQKATKVVVAWMRTFSRDRSVDERATDAMTTK